MKKIRQLLSLDLLGLLLGFSGSIMSAIAIGDLPFGLTGFKSSIGNVDFKVAYITNPNLFNWGLRLIALGFICQFLNKAIEMCKGK